MKKTFATLTLLGMLLFGTRSHAQSNAGAVCQAETRLSDLSAPTQFYQLKVIDTKKSPNTLFGLRFERSTGERITYGLKIPAKNSESTAFGMLGDKKSFGINHSVSAGDIRASAGIEDAGRQRLRSLNIEDRDGNIRYSIGYSGISNGNDDRNIIDVSGRYNLGKLRYLQKLSIDTKSIVNPYNHILVAGTMPVHNAAYRLFVRSRSDNNFRGKEQNFLSDLVINPKIGEGWFHGTADEWFDQSIIKDLTLGTGILPYTFGEVVYEINYKANPGLEDFLSSVYKAFGKDNLLYAGIGGGYTDGKTGKHEKGFALASVRHGNAFLESRCSFSEGNPPFYSISTHIGTNNIPKEKLRLEVK